MLSPENIPHPFEFMPPNFGRNSLFGIIPYHVLWNMFIILVIALIFYWLIRGTSKSTESPLDLLKKRYVSGEIDRDTFLKMKEDISD